MYRDGRHGPGSGCAGQWGRTDCRGAHSIVGERTAFRSHGRHVPTTGPALAPLFARATDQVRGSLVPEPRPSRWVRPVRVDRGDVMAALRVRSAIGLTAALLIAVAVATGCTASPAAPDRASASQSVTTGGTTHTPTGAASKSGDGTLRTDLEPLTTRFAALGAPVSAQWSSGTMGDSRVPGPSTYWIDAVVVVSPDVASRLATSRSGRRMPPRIWFPTWPHWCRRASSSRHRSSRRHSRSRTGR